MANLQVSHEIPSPNLLVPGRSARVLDPRRTDTFGAQPLADTSGNTINQSITRAYGLK